MLDKLPDVLDQPVSIPEPETITSVGAKSPETLKERKAIFQSPKPEVSAKIYGLEINNQKVDDYQASPEPNRDLPVDKMDILLIREDSSDQLVIDSLEGRNAFSFK